MRILFYKPLAYAISLSLAAVAPVAGQSARAVASNVRVLSPVKTTQVRPLQGHVPEWATDANDLGPLPSIRRLDNLHLILSRAPQVQAAFEQLLADQQNPASTRYHQWLTPQQNAEKFGVAPSDLAAVTAWMQAQGLSVDDVAAGGVFVTFSGSVSAVETAFSTHLHSFAHPDAARYAPTSDPAIPAALAGVVQSIGGLTELYSRPSIVLPAEPLPRSALYPEEPASAHPAGAAATPSYTLTGTSGTVYHFLSPGDFSLIYNVNPVYDSGITGTGSRVAILGGSRVESADVTAYETLFSLPAQQPNFVVLPTGTDPGFTGDSTEGEAILDVDRVIATAPGAGADLLIAKNALSFTVTFSLLQYNISTLNDPVQSLSFGACESNSSSKTYAQQFDMYFSTAAAQGIGTYVSSGDNGAAGCNAGSTAVPATQVLAPNLLCASSFATCVGGTEFADFTNPSAYWSSTNSATKVSALGYIPEGAWNEPSYVNSSGNTIFSGEGTGGGVSITIAKPAYQAGVGVPADGARDTPDMSFASSTHNAYVLCYAAGGASCGTGGYLYPVGGTSAAAPSMAGVAALLNQKRGARQGNLNPVFYRLAAATPSNGAFHDVTPATAGVTSCTTATPSLCNNSTPSPTSLSGGLAGYAITTGYDLATGLGSLDVNAFITAANIGITPSTVSITAMPSPTMVGANTTLTATIVPTGTATPSGTVQFYADGKAIGVAASVASNVATMVYNFPATGNIAITAVYSGDPTFASQTAAAITLEVDPALFTLTPSGQMLTTTSAAAMTVTTDVGITATASFSGTIALSCRVVRNSGSAAGACSMDPASVTLGTGGFDHSIVTLTVTPGTSGILNLIVTGVSGATDYSAAPIVVTVAAPGFTIAATPSSASLLAGNSVTSNFTVNSANFFEGNVNLACTLAKTSGSAAGTCTVTPQTVALTSNASANGTLTVATTTGTSGVLTATITGAGTTTGASIPATATATVTLTVDTPRFTLSASPAALGTITAGATAGNSSTITLTSVNGLAAAVSLTCTAALTTGGATSNPPSCSLNSSSITLTAGGTQTATATIGTSAGTSSCLTSHLSVPGDLPNYRRLPEGMAVATLLLTLFPVRRHKAFRGLMLFSLMLAGLATLGGCSGGGTAPTKACSTVIVARTTAGAYTVTVTGVSGSLTSSTTFTVTLN